MNGLIAFSQRFSTPEECLAHIESVRWKKGRIFPEVRFYVKDIPL